MKPIKPIKPAPSIPVKVKGKQLSLQSENIKKIQKYQSDHFLEQIDKPGRIDKFSEQVPPLPCQFKQKQEKEFISLPEFIQLENPPPFGGAQAVNDLSDEKEILEQQLQLQLVKYLRITQLKKQQEKDRYSSIDEAQQEDSFETLRDLQIELQKEHDQYIEDFVKKLENEKVEKKVNQFIRLPLPELLRITDHFDMEKKDKFRALSAQERKSVQIDHQKKQEEIKVEGKIKNLKEMEAMIEETKKDYFKIIRDLDMLNKGARQIKNFTSQQYGLRKKIEEPNIDNLLKKVKDTIWYHGGVTEGFDREMDLIKYKNSQAKNLLDINKVIEQSELEEKKQKEKEEKDKEKEKIKQQFEKEQEQKNEKIQQKMDQSYASQKTQATVKSTNKVISSKKGKELMDMMSEDLF